MILKLIFLNIYDFVLLCKTKICQMKTCLKQSRNLKEILILMFMHVLIFGTFPDLIRPYLKIASSLCEKNITLFRMCDSIIIET